LIIKKNNLSWQNLHIQLTQPASPIFWKEYSTKGSLLQAISKIQIADIDLITIKIRLLIASVDKAMEMGINWWQEDTYLSTKAREKELMQQQETLEARLEKLEAVSRQS